MFSGFLAAICRPLDENAAGAAQGHGAPLQFAC